MFGPKLTLEYYECNDVLDALMARMHELELLFATATGDLAVKLNADLARARSAFDKTFDYREKIRRIA